MTDTTDDIAEEISFQSFDDDCRLLGNLLNDILHREVGTTFVDKLERIRVLAQVSFCEKTQLFSFCSTPFCLFYMGFSCFAFSFIFVLLGLMGFFIFGRVRVI